MRYFRETAKHFPLLLIQLLRTMNDDHFKKSIKKNQLPGKIKNGSNASPFAPMQDIVVILFPLVWVESRSRDL